jgi:primosomal protein N' (replication factor Y)
VNHDYSAFVREELDGRVSPPYPPNIRLANIVFSGVVEDDVAKLALSAGEWLRDLVAHAKGSIEIVGPAPAPIERIKTRWRWHVLLKSDIPAELTRVGRYFMEKFEVPASGQMRITLDRDPVTLL